MNKTYIVKFFKVPHKHSGWNIPRGYAKATPISFNTFRVGQYVLVWGSEETF